MGEMLVMEVEIGEIKATHTETTVQDAGKRALKAQTKAQRNLVFFFIWIWCPQCTGDEQ